VSSRPPPPPRKRAAGPRRRTGRSTTTKRRPKPKTQRDESAPLPKKRVPPIRYPVLPRILRAGITRPELDELTQSLSWQRKVPVIEPVRVNARHLHIAMVGWEYPPVYAGGLGVHVYELTKELTRMGHRVTFLTPFSGPFHDVPGVTFIWPTDPENEDRPYPPAYWAIEEAQPGQQNAIDAYNEWVGARTELKEVDVVHVHDWFGTVGAVTLAHRLKVPLVMTMHSTEYDRSLNNPWTEILVRETIGLTQADRVIAVSRHLKQQLIHRFRVPADRIRVVYNAVRPAERLARLEATQSIVLYLGRLVAMKGVETFLRAAAKAAPHTTGTLFVVAGEGPEYPRLLMLAAHLGIGDRVLFLGRVSEDERSLLLAAASVFVLPSVVEPFGIAALEAMVAGVPTIVSKTSGVAEVTENIFALDFWDIDEFASRIVELLRYPALRHSMGTRGRWDALKSGWPERTLETVAVYMEVVERGAPRT
jgi:glycogen(starch) synthase